MSEEAKWSVLQVLSIILGPASFYSSAWQIGLPIKWWKFFIVIFQLIQMDFSI